MDGGLRLVEMVDQFWHLGHPITASGLAGEAYDMARRNFMDVLNHFNLQQLPERARIQLVNIVLLPKLLYMLECLTPMVSVLKELSLKICSFVKMIVGVPMRLVEKSMFSTN